MYGRLCIEIYTSKNAAEPEKVLIFKPCGTASLIDLYTKTVILFLYIRCQVKIGGRKTVFRIAHKLTVQPDITCLLYALKRYTDSLSQKPGSQVKHLYIAAHSRILPINLRRPQLRMTIPGVQGIDVLYFTEALKLHMPRNLNRPKAGIIILCLPKISRPLCRRFAPAKLPLPIQRLAQGAFSLCQLFSGSIAYVVRMRIQAVHPEYSGIGKPI